MTNQTEQANEAVEAKSTETVEERRRALLAKFAAGALATPVVLSALMSKPAVASPT